MCYRTDLLGMTITFLAALLATLARNSITPGLAALSISFSFENTGALSWMVQMVCAMETNSVCLERLMEYFNLNPEGDWEKTLEPQFARKRGEIVFHDYATR